MDRTNFKLLPGESVRQPSVLMFVRTPSYAPRISMEAVAKRADVALYEAKQAGRDCVRGDVESGAARAVVNGA